MNSKQAYNYEKWVKKEKTERFFFKLKSFYYSIGLKKAERIKWFKLERSTISLVLNKIVKAVGYLLILLLISRLLNLLFIFLDWNDVILKNIKYRSDLFTSFLISCVSIAGFLLALFYANLSGIFTSRYAHISSRVSNELLHEYTNQKYIDSIQNYIITILLILVMNILSINTSYVLATIILFLTIRIIIIFIELSKRIFVYSEIILIGNTSFSKICDYINKVQLGYFEYKNNAFQEHHRELALNNIQILSDLSDSLISDNDSEGLNKLLAINLKLISIYSSVKNRIPFDSLWFPDSFKHKIWFRESDNEILLRINTGTSMNPKLERYNHFFENHLFDINRKIIDYFIVKSQIMNLYLYVEMYHEEFSNFSKNGDFEFWLENINILSNIIISNLEKKKSNQSEYIKGLLDLLVTVKINYILSFSNYFVDAQKFLLNLNLNEIDQKEVLNLNLKFINSNKFTEFIAKLDNERYVEGRLITSKDYIQEYIYYLFNEELIGYVSHFSEILFEINGVSQQVLSLNLTMEAAVIDSRIIELSNKISDRLIVMEELYKSYIKYNNSNFNYKEIDFNEIRKKIKSQYFNSIDNFSQSTTKLYFLKYNLKEDQMDFLGQIYYQLTQYILELIVEDDFESFKKVYPMFDMICTISGDYIRDIIPKNSNLNYVIRKYTMTTINFMNISGFLIYYSRLTGNMKWEETVLALIKSKEENNRMRFIKHCKSCADIYNQNNLSVTLFDTSLKNTFEGFIRNKIQEINDDLGKNGQTTKKPVDDILRKFEFNSRGFTYEIFEIYLIYCLNEFLESEDRYLTKFSWAERRES